MIAVNLYFDIIYIYMNPTTKSPFCLVVCNSKSLQITAIASP